MTDWKALAAKLGVGHLDFDDGGAAKMPGGAVLMLAEVPGHARWLIYEDAHGNQTSGDNARHIAALLRLGATRLEDRAAEMRATAALAHPGSATAPGAMEALRAERDAALAKVATLEARWAELRDHIEATDSCHAWECCGAGHAGSNLARMDEMEAEQ